MSKPNEEQTIESRRWTAMQSMREIDTNSFIKIELPHIYK